MIDRKRWLRDLFADSTTLVFVNGVIGAGHQVFELAQTNQFKGMAGKRLFAISTATLALLDQDEGFWLLAPCVPAIDAGSLFAARR